MAKATKKIQVGIADDHSLLRNALANLINTFEGYSILFEADNGKDLRNKIMQHMVPDIVLLDVNMPEMDGFETTQWLHKNYPHIRVLALSMLSDEKTIIKMFRLGAKGYLLKNAEPAELREALDSLMDKNVYLSEYVSGKLVSGLQQTDLEASSREVVLNEKEREFLRWVCSELSYKDIAAKMYISARTADDYRQSLFNKLKVHSRVGLVMYAIKHGIVEV
ncbi:MAG: response regulator transcription factor [Sphingobacteriales bacterium]|jgi:DNA-binding NarL/FixJ family response regulator|nr:response regulator transcription factor [Sphingobacteriales bacterium]NCT75905.1 response regulator transcription factor [Chitinophagaceae bacterium]OJW32577.1 MAG: DNA-binding response regulator [Sphingobacteriales bacterium 46-32]